MDLKQYQAQTLVEVAYKALKKDITERVLVPGEKIILREVNERYGISPTPIKQALNRLIAEGLVESIPRRGIRVRVIKGEEIAELMDIRLMIETYYIQRIIRSFDEGLMREKLMKNLREQIRIIERVANIEDYFKYYNLDFEFHQMYLRGCKNKKILQIYNSLGTHGYAFYVYRNQEIESLIAGVKEHENIYNAIAAKDEDVLRKCIEIHINNAKNKILQMLKSKQAVF
ncbi:MAG: GntR family transcriptional regulator [Bacteroidota bacterium]